MVVTVCVDRVVGMGVIATCFDRRVVRGNRKHRGGLCRIG